MPPTIMILMTMDHSSSFHTNISCCFYLLLWRFRLPKEEKGGRDNLTCWQLVIFVREISLLFQVKCRVKCNDHDDERQKARENEKEFAD